MAASAFTYKRNYNTTKVYAQRFNGARVEIITAALVNRGQPFWAASFDPKDPAKVIKDYPHPMTEAELPDELRERIQLLAKQPLDWPLAERNRAVERIIQKRRRAVRTKRH